MKKLLLMFALLMSPTVAAAADNIICADDGSSQCILVDINGNNWRAQAAFTTDGSGDIFTLGDVASTDNIIGSNPSSNRTLIDNLGRRWAASVFYTTDGNGNIIPIPSGGGGGGGNPGGATNSIQYKVNGTTFGGFGTWDGTTFNNPGAQVVGATLNVFGTTHLGSILTTTNNTLDDGSGNGNMQSLVLLALGAGLEVVGSSSFDNGSASTDGSGGIMAISYIANSGSEGASITPVNGGTNGPVINLSTSGTPYAQINGDGSASWPGAGVGWDSGGNAFVASMAVDNYVTLAGGAGTVFTVESGAVSLDGGLCFTDGSGHLTCNSFSGDGSNLTGNAASFSVGFANNSGNTGLANTALHLSNGGSGDISGYVTNPALAFVSNLPFYDTSGDNSIDFNSRQLYAIDGSLNLDYSSPVNGVSIARLSTTFIDDPGNNNVLNFSTIGTINFFGPSYINDAGQLGLSSGITDGTLMSIDTNNRHLIANDGSTINLDWSTPGQVMIAPNLYAQNFGTPTLGTASGAFVIQSQSGTLPVFISNGIVSDVLYDATSVESSVYVTSRQLVASDGSTVNLDWSVPGTVSGDFTTAIFNDVYAAGGAHLTIDGLGFSSGSEVYDAGSGTLGFNAGVASVDSSGNISANSFSGGGGGLTGVTADTASGLDGPSSATITDNGIGGWNSSGIMQGGFQGGFFDPAFTPGTALIADGSNRVVSSGVSSTELGYVSGVTSAIQTQFNAITSGQGSTTWPLSTGSLTSIVANEIIGGGKTGQAMTLRSITASAAGFTCIANPVLTLLDCGTSAGACTAGTTTMGTVTLTAANTLTAGTVSIASIAAGHFWAWQVTSGTCTALNANGSGELGSVLQ